MEWIKYSIRLHQTVKIFETRSEYIWSNIEDCWINAMRQLAKYFQDWAVSIRTFFSAKRFRQIAMKLAIDQTVSNNYLQSSKDSWQEM